MSMSANVVQETSAALRKCDNLEGAAYELDLSVQGLSYRINNNPTLMEIAISRGLYKPRKKAQVQENKTVPVRDPGPVIEKTVEPDQKPEPDTNPTPAHYKKRKEGYHRIDIDIPDDIYAALENQAECEMRPVKIQALWIIKHVVIRPEEVCGS